MHVEDMHARRSLRMLLIRFPDEVPTTFPGGLELTVRERNGPDVPARAPRRDRPPAPLAGLDARRGHRHRHRGPAQPLRPVPRARRRDRRRRRTNSRHEAFPRTSPQARPRHARNAPPLRGHLFALGWLFVFVTSLNETEILKALASNSEENRFRWLRSMGLEEQPPSVSIMMTFWNHPFIILIIAHLGHRPGLDRRRGGGGARARST